MQGSKTPLLTFGAMAFAVWALVFFAGAMDGGAEALKYRYAQFKQLFPDADESFWDPQVSWKNKYKNGEVEQGDAFPLSITVLVGFTDGYHLFRTLRNIALSAALALCIGIPRENKGWKYYLADGIFFLALFAAGFFSVFGILFMR